MQKLFVYGTLQQPQVQHSVIGRQVKSYPDKLIGFSKETVKINGKTYPIAVASDNGAIEGMVLEIEDEDLIKLDDYETKAYSRIKVHLNSGQEAWIYCQP